jgi:HK97 family phage portal protein
MGFWSRLLNPFRNSMSSLDLFRKIYGGRLSSSGIVVNSNTAMQCGAVYACVRVLSESIAQTQLPIYRRKQGGGRVQSFSHPLHTLLNISPNQWQTAFEFREMIMGHLCLRGNAFAWKNLVGGQVRELIPLHPDFMLVRQLPDYSLEYTYTNPNSGKQDTIPTEQIWHLRGLSSNGFVGLNPIEQQREAIGLSLATERHGARLFANAGRPGGVLRHPKILSDKAKRALQESFDREHSGDNAHSTLVLEEGMEWSQVGMTSEDAQFLQTRKYQRSEIASIFRVPPHMIGDLERATFSNIEQQSIEFVSYTLGPWMRRIEQSISKFLMTDAERAYTFPFHNSGDLLRGDKQSRYTAYASARNNGWLNGDEIQGSGGNEPDAQRSGAGLPGQRQHDSD